MSVITEAQAGANVPAFLDMLAWSEGTSTSKHTKNDGYDVIVGGINSPNTFDNYDEHPGVLVTVNSKGLRSTAAGRYQLLNRFAKLYMASMMLPDFSPLSQDKIAIQQIKERGAMRDIEAGRISQAIEKCRNIWASLPGAGYGQREHKIDDLIAHYVAAGGKLAA